MKKIKLNIKTEVNGGRGPQPDAEENKNLASDYMGMTDNGLAMADLVAKYKSSPKNLYDRLKRMGVPRNTKPKQDKTPKPFYEGTEN